MRVLGFGTYDVTTHPRMGVLLAGLQASGVSVEEINEPLRLDTAARVAILRQPWRLPQLVLRLLSRWFVLARRVRGMAPPDAVLVGYLGQFDVLLARALFRRTPIALDFLISGSDTARDRGESGLLKSRLLSWLDAAALRADDIIVCDTEEHAMALPERFRPRAVVALVGASGPWLGAGATRPNVNCHRPLRVVFFGLFTPLQGTPTIGAALARLYDRPDIEACMIGGGQELAEARRAAAGNPQVTWRDWVSSADLPGIVASYDICLGIFGTGPKALRVVPNKVFQGAAAGCALVTGDTAPQRRVLGDAAVFVPPGDAEALAKALAELADDREKLASLQRAARTVAESTFTPEQVARPVVTRLARLVEERKAVA